MSKQQDFWVSSESELMANNPLPWHLAAPVQTHPHQQQQFALLDQDDYHAPPPLDLALGPLFESHPDIEHLGLANFQVDNEESGVLYHSTGDPEEKEQGQGEVVAEAQTSRRREGKRTSKYHSKSATPSFLLQVFSKSSFSLFLFH